MSGRSHRSNVPLALFIVALAVIPFTAPFQTLDPAGTCDSVLLDHNGDAQVTNRVDPLSLTMSPELTEVTSPTDGLRPILTTRPATATAAARSTRLGVVVLRL